MISKLPATVLLNRLVTKGRFRHLEVLLRLCELGSVQRTADAFGTTQSAVTQALATIESLLDTTLFVRHARGVSPTRACLELLPIARQVIGGLQAGTEKIAALGRESAQVVRLAATPSGLNSVLFEALPAFAKKRPDIKVTLKEAQLPELLMDATSGDVDIVVSGEPEAQPDGWRFQPLIEDEMVAVVGVEHPLAGRGRLEVTALEGFRLLLPTVQSLAREKYEALLAPKLQGPVELFPVITRAHTAMWGCLINTDIIGIAPRSAVRHLEYVRALVALPLDPAIELPAKGMLVPVETSSESARSLETFLMSRAAPSQV